jgi:NAD(P)-dependent dehydrogenase (short-subunit alcohol dehydrogenase family)
MTDQVGCDDPPYRLEGEVALVTGASRGVGAATAMALADAGCGVACAARSTDASPKRTPGTLDTTVAAITGAHGQGRAIAVPTDLSDSDQVVAMVATTVEAFGRLDILVNNAAVTFVGDLDIPLRRHDLIMEINLRAPLIAIRAAVPHMRASGRGGRIVNVSSLAALNPIPGLMSYGVSKIGLERLTVDAARQLAKDGIAVNCFRIDVPVASEGFVANEPEANHSTWEPAEVAAEGIRWMVCQPASYSGRRESMAGLRRREGIMPSRSAQPHVGTPGTEMFDGLAGDTETIFR